MKLHNLLIFSALLLFFQCTSPTTEKATDRKTDEMRVAVFDGHGGAQTCIWEAVAAIKLDAEMVVRTITTADIANNVLD